MDFSYSEEQEMLRKIARDFLATECPRDTIRQMIREQTGHDPKLWQKMAELGWMGLVIPEEFGGTGGSFLDAAALIEETGRASLPGPFFTTLVGTLALMNMGSQPQKQELLPQVAEGSMVLTLAISEPGVGYELDAIRSQATVKNGGYVIKGTKLFVDNADVADMMICLAGIRSGTGKRQVTPFLVDMRSPGVVCTPLQSLGGEKQFQVTLKNVKVPHGRMLAEGMETEREVRRLIKWAATLKCAEMVGGAQQVMDMTTDYVKERVQFDHPIGSLQALQHHCANMLIDLEGMKYITYLAAWRINEGIPYSKEAAMAKSWNSDAYKRICDLAHQCHGAIGFCEDHDLPLYSKRVMPSAFAFGDAPTQRQFVARAIGL